MPKIISINIRNFKGANNVTINFSKKIDTPVVTLVGLNESGKTTILEALSYFVTGDNAVSSLFDGVHRKAEVASLIPIDRKPNFTDQVVIEAIVQLDDSDYERAAKTAKKNGFTLDREDFHWQFDVSRIYRFEDSSLKEESNDWGFQLKVKKGKSLKSKDYPSNSTEIPNLWTLITDEIEERLPRIAYFPTFLVDLPQKIYLERHDNERPVNRYYRRVLQDVLTSIDPDLSLEKHVSKRIADYKATNSGANWIATFFGSPNKTIIDSVFHKMSSAISKQVLGSWQKIFNRPISTKSISLEWNIDPQKGEIPYVSFWVSDGESKYALNERSLGFRWFFAFLLFTAFKKASTDSTLFVFDEPAANLHARAQAELLNTFEKIIKDGNRIVYSTHSHHMINPRWLSGAYIVENAAIDFDSNDAFGLNTKPTDIRAAPYRDFVSQYSSRTSYYQPVIEKLEYVTPEIIGTSPFLVVEGITDFQALRLAAMNQKLPFSILPGCGAGASGPLISLLLGRGDVFLVICDDDKAGKEAVERYRREWLLSSDVAMTIAELNPKFKDKKLEQLLSPETLAKIAAKLSKKPGEVSKKEKGLYFAEELANGNEHALSDQTRADILLIVEELKKKFPAN